MFLAKFLTAVTGMISLVISQVGLVWEYGLMSLSTMTVLFVLFGLWLGSGFFAALNLVATQFVD